jgi:Peptidase C10 family
MNRKPLKLLFGAGCLVLLLALGTPAALAAGPSGPFSEDQVRSAVETWVRTVPVEARPDAEIAGMEPYREQGEIAAYIAHLAGGGFCLAGADTTVLPVYFFSPQGTYDPASPDLQAILHEIAMRRQAAQRALSAGGDALTPALQAALEDREAYWAELIAGREPAAPVAPASPGIPAGIAAEPAYLVLPLTTLWDQGAPYFDQLPILTPATSQHTLVGCNGTASAQIMAYWKWPVNGVGSACVSYPYRYRTSWQSAVLNTPVAIPTGWDGRLRYDATNHVLQMNGYWDGSVYDAAEAISADAAYQTALATLWAGMTQAAQQPCANFGAATYDWSLVRDTNSEPPDAAGNEAAKISAHAAIGVNSNLGIWFTGSYFGNDVAGLTAYFRYDPDALYTANPGNGGPGADIASLTAEITWGRPAGLGGSGARGGHAWVVDGYDKSSDPNRLFHMNLGWGGSENGWYTLDSAPLPLEHDMMSRVAPTVVKFAAASGAAGDGSPATPYGNITQAVTSAPAGSTLMLQAGSEYGFSAPLVIDRALTIKGFGVTIR